MRLTKLICTLGPASTGLVGPLVEAGMDVARLNFSHGRPDERGDHVRTIRREAHALGRPVGILADLSGPKVRLGPIAEGQVELVAGQPFRLGPEHRPGGPSGAATSHPDLSRDVQPGDRLLLADGVVELRVTTCDGPDCVTEVVRGGVLRSGAGVNVPSHRLSLPALTERDAADVEQALDLGIDLIAQSFVRRAEDVVALRGLVGNRARIVAKIETGSAVADIERILPVADAIMVARGDLGVEIPFEEIPLVQDDLVARAVQAGVPVIVATQMLESMIQAVRPTRAEVGDVATAVFQRADAILLSAETAIGRYPLDAARAAVRVLRAAERRNDSPVPGRAEALSDAEGVARAAASMAHRMSDVAAIACFTRTGRAAALVAAARPAVPVYAFTPSEDVACTLTLHRGVVPLLAEEPKDTDEMLLTMEQRMRPIVPPGHAVLMVAPTPFGRSHTNLLKVHRVAAG